MPVARLCHGLGQTKAAYLQLVKVAALAVVGHCLLWAAVVALQLVLVPVLVV